MANRPTVEVVITSDVRDFSRGVNEAKDHATKLGAVAGVAAAAVSAGLSAIAGAASKAVDFLKDSVKAASDLEQATGAVESVFKDQAGAIDKWSKQSAKSMGLSETQYKNMAAVAGAMLKGMGLPLKQTAELTNTLTKRAADMAATFGGTTADAMEAIAALMRGERDPIEKYGVSLKQVDINARLAAKGQSKLTGSAKTQAEAQAGLDILMQKTADTAGQFSREQKTLAGRTQIATAEFENMKATIGAKLMPIVLAMWDLFQFKVVPVLHDLWDIGKQVVNILWHGDFTGGPFQEDSDFVKAIFRIRNEFLWYYTLLNDNVIPVIKTLWSWIDQSLVPTLKVLALIFAVSLLGPTLAVVYAINLLVEAVAAAWSWLAGRFGPILEHVWHVIADQFLPGVLRLYTAIAALLVPIFKVWWAIMDGAILPLLGWIAEKLHGPLKVAVDVVGAVLGWLIDNILKGLVSQFDAVMKVINLLVGTLTWLAVETRKAFQGVGDLFNTVLDTIKQIVEWIGKIRFPSAPSWLGKIPGFAGGVTNFAGGMAMVGERGPELVMLPRGSSVVPNGQTQKILNGGSTVIDLHIDLGGEVIRRQVKVQLAEHDKALARRIKARA